MILAVVTRGCLDELLFLKAAFTPGYMIAGPGAIAVKHSMWKGDQRAFYRSLQELPQFLLFSGGVLIVWFSQMIVSKQSVLRRNQISFSELGFLSRTQITGNPLSSIFLSGQLLGEGLIFREI